MGDDVKELFGDGAVTVPALKLEFGISHTAAYELMRSGRLPYTQMGRKRLIPRRAVIELLAARLQTGKGAAHVA